MRARPPAHQAAILRLSRSAASGAGHSTSQLGHNAGVAMRTLRGMVAAGRRVWRFAWRCRLAPPSPLLCISYLYFVVSCGCGFVFVLLKIPGRGGRDQRQSVYCRQWLATGVALMRGAVVEQVRFNGSRFTESKVCQSAAGAGWSRGRRIRPGGLKFACLGWH